MSLTMPSLCRPITLPRPLTRFPTFSSRFSTRSWRDIRISAAKNSPRYCRDLGEISESRRPKTHQDSRRDLKISTAKSSPRFSPRSQNLGGQKLTENLGKISSEIFVRSQRLGHPKLAENLGKTCRDIISLRKLEDILKCQHSDPGKLIINSLSEVV